MHRYQNRIEQNNLQYNLIQSTEWFFHCRRFDTDLYAFFKLFSMIEKKKERDKEKCTVEHRDCMIMWRHKVDINPIRMPMQIANVKDKLAAACTLLDIFHIYFYSIDWFVDIHKNNICTEKKHTQNSSMQTLHKKKRIQQSARCIFSFLSFFLQKKKNCVCQRISWTLPQLNTNEFACVCRLKLVGLIRLKIAIYHWK